MSIIYWVLYRKFLFLSFLFYFLSLSSFFFLVYSLSSLICFFSSRGYFYKQVLSYLFSIDIPYFFFIIKFWNEIILSRLLFYLVPFSSFAFSLWNIEIPVFLTNSRYAFLYKREKFYYRLWAESIRIFGWFSVQEKIILRAGWNSQILLFINKHFLFNNLRVILLIYHSQVSSI